MPQMIHGKLQWRDLLEQRVGLGWIELDGMAGTRSLARTLHTPLRRYARGVGVKAASSASRPISSSAACKAGVTGNPRCLRTRANPGARYINWAGCQLPLQASELAPTFFFDNSNSSTAVSLSPTASRVRPRSSLLSTYVLRLWTT